VPGDRRRRPRGVLAPGEISGEGPRHPRIPGLLDAARGAAQGARFLRGDRDALLGDGPCGAPPVGRFGGRPREIRRLDRIEAEDSRGLRPAPRGRAPGRSDPACPGPDRPGDRRRDAGGNRRLHPGRGDRPKADGGIALAHAGERSRAVTSRMPCRARAAAALVVAGTLAGTAGAATWWRLPIWGAEIRVFALDPFTPGSLYCGTSRGNFYGSTDGGASWAPLRTGPAFPGYVVTSLIA